MPDDLLEEGRELVARVEKVEDRLLFAPAQTVGRAPVETPVLSRRAMVQRETGSLLHRKVGVDELIEKRYRAIEYVLVSHDRMEPGRAYRAPGLTTSLLYDFRRRRRRRRLRCAIRRGRLRVLGRL